MTEPEQVPNLGIANSSPPKKLRDRVPNPAVFKSE